MPATNNMRFGPAGFTGTAAPLTTVKAGVRSCTFAMAACSWVFIVLSVELQLHVVLQVVTLRTETL